MNIKFYFDPSCPFCWITSRWLLQVSSKREVSIEWIPFSLAIKNNELDDQSKNPSPYADEHIAANRVIRVMIAAHKKGAKMVDLYSSFGVQKHVFAKEFSDELIKKILADQNLSAELFKSADDKSLDRISAKYIKEATSIVGNNIGVPTIVFVKEDKSSAGYFGPVLQKLPELDQSLDIWDGIVKLISCDAFYELKRDRDGSGPDVFSTAKC